MQLDRITIALRPRTSREAIDLGTKLLRANARAVWSAWFMATAPIFILLNVGFGLLGKPWLAGVAMWWLKPAFDRLPLFVFSRTLFGETPTWRATLRGQGAWRWGPTLAQLSWLRLSPMRTLRLPLVFLEGLRGAAASTRWHVVREPLVRRTAFLTQCCLLFELSLYVSLWMLVPMLVPNELWPSSHSAFIRLLDSLTTGGLVYASNLTFYLAMSVIEPLYVAAGFALYINRRTQLECWDLDLAFRRLGSRAAASLVVLLACMILVPHVARAADAKPPPVSIDKVFKPIPADMDKRLDAAATVTAKDPLLGRKVTRMEWQWRLQPKSKAPTHMSSAGTGLQLFGFIMKMLLYALAIGAVIALVVALVRHIGRIQGGGRANTRRKPLVDAIEVQHDVEAPMPADLAGAVRELWNDGHPRAALALLYRGTAEAVFSSTDIDWSPAATEADCLRRASQLNVPAHGEHARRIVRAWQAAAYADRLPDDATVEVLLAGWPLRTVEVGS